MGKIRRGGFIFVSWKSDHGPNHVHVYKKGKFILKWDMENQKLMKGQLDRKIISLIAKLQTEGRI